MDCLSVLFLQSYEGYAYAFYACQTYTHLTIEAFFGLMVAGVAEVFRAVILDLSSFSERMVKLLFFLHGDLCLSLTQ